MILDLSRIRTPHTVIERVFSPDAFGPGDESYTIAAPVKLHADIAKDGARFRVSGRVETTLELTCSRCIEPFAWPVDATFDITYHPQSTNVGEGEVEIGEDDLTTAYYENDQIDLAGLMREQFYLSLPMKPLCGEDCKGLCPICGTNLNRATCDCHPQWEDPRMAALKALKKES